MNTKLTFGKFNGETLAYIAQFEPGYLDWMYAEGIIDISIIHARDRGEYKRKKLKDGYAIVF